MVLYQMRSRNGAGIVLGTVRAPDMDEAAQRLARRLHGRNSMALRVTGTVGMSGIYQAYKPLRNSSGETSIGAPFHLSEVS